MKVLDLHLFRKWQIWYFRIVFLFRIWWYFPFIGKRDYRQQHFVKYFWPGYWSFRLHFKQMINFKKVYCDCINQDAVRITWVWWQFIILYVLGPFLSFTVNFWVFNLFKWFLYWLIGFLYWFKWFLYRLKWVFSWAILVTEFLTLMTGIICRWLRWYQCVIHFPFVVFYISFTVLLTHLNWLSPYLCFS